MIAREIDRRKGATGGDASTVSKAKSVFLGATIAHGYKPGRAVLSLVALWLVGVALLRGEPGRQTIVPTKIPAVAQTTLTGADQLRDARSCPPRYPCFNAWVYAAETVVPLIKFGQTDNWHVAGGTSRYRIWVWSATALGWLFSTLAVAGLTGVIRKD